MCISWNYNTVIQTNIKRKLSFSAVGDAVKEDDVVCEIETDKVRNQEFVYHFCLVMTRCTYCY